MNKLYVAGGIIGLTFFLFSFSINPPDGHTGAPGDMFCSQCHIQNNVNVGGTITLDGFPEVIVPNETYLLTLTNRDTIGNAVRGGFQLTVLSPFNTRAGDLTSPSASSTVSIQGGRQYWEHNPAKEYPDSNVVSWTVSWTAPDLPAGSKITWYAAGNIADGNFSNTGDRIVLDNGNGLIMLSGIRESYQTKATVFPNPGTEHLNIVFENEARLDGKVYFYSPDGRRMATLSMNDGIVNTETLAKGFYIIQTLADDHASLLKWSKL